MPSRSRRSPSGTCTTELSTSLRSPMPAPSPLTHPSPPSMMRGRREGTSTLRWSFVLRLSRTSSLQWSRICLRKSFGSISLVYLSSSTPLPLSLLLPITRAITNLASPDLAQGVQHMHAHNLIHLDIKPDNILVGFDSSLKLTGMYAKREEEREGGIVVRDE